MTGQPVAENRLRHREQIGDPRVGQLVQHRRAFLPADDDATRAKLRELLRHDRLIQIEPRLEPLEDGRQVFCSS